MNFFRKKAIPTKSSESSLMKKNLTVLDLLLLGVGAIVGTGIFIITGRAASDYAGPAAILSFIIAAVSVMISGLFYAEFASRIPSVGGPYAYLYSVLGEGFAWLTGWLMILEFTLAVSSTAVGWTSYFRGMFHIPLPVALSASYNPSQGSYVDLLAMLLLFVITLWTMREAKQMLRLNELMVYVKFAVIALFLVVGTLAIKPQNWIPFMPYGFFGKNGHGGVMAGAALVFFAYLGFESVPMAVDEVDQPEKKISKAILGSIALTTILYILVTLVLTGMTKYTKLHGVDDPVAFALKQAGHPLISSIAATAIILTLLTVAISMMYSLSRLIYAVSRDGLLPKIFSQVDPKSKIPRNATIVAGLLAIIFAGFFPLNLLAEFVNVATLAYLILMAIGIIVMRQKFGQPDPTKSQFKVPFVPLLPIISICCCLYLIAHLHLNSWILLGSALLLGLIIYFGYGQKNSKLNQ